MPKHSGGQKSSSSHFQSSSQRFSSSSFRNGGRGVGLAGRNFIQTVMTGTNHTLVLINGQVYTGTYTGVVGGLISLAGVTIPGVIGTVTLLIGPNAVVAYTP
jgi:hypothetical protein